jgi:transcriptional regulator with XRE-family HTH domain
VFDARIRDGSTHRIVTYAVRPDALVIVEVLRQSPDLQENTFPVFYRLRDYFTVEGRLDGSAWIVGNVADFLQLTEGQATSVDIRAALAEELQLRRNQRGWSQGDVARLMRTNVSRVAKMEQPDCSVSLDQMVNALLAVGVSRSQLATVIANSGWTPSISRPGARGWHGVQPFRLNAELRNEFDAVLRGRYIWHDVAP